MNLTLQINPKYDRIKIEMPYIMTRSVLLSLELDPALRFRQLSEVRPTHNEFFHIQKTQIYSAKPLYMSRQQIAGENLVMDHIILPSNMDSFSLKFDTYYMNYHSDYLFVNF